MKFFPDGNNQIENRHNTKTAYGSPNEQLFPKMWSLSYLNLTKYHLDTKKVIIAQECHLSPNKKHKEPHQRYCLGTVSNLKSWGCLNRFNSISTWP